MFNNLRDEELIDLFLYHSGGTCWGHNSIHEGLGSSLPAGEAGVPTIRFSIFSSPLTRFDSNRGEFSRFRNRKLRRASRVVGMGCLVYFEYRNG